MPELNEIRDDRLNKRKDARDVLISYALLMPTLLGIVKATDSGRLRELSQTVRDLLSSSFSQTKYAGQKILSSLAKQRVEKDVEVESVVPSISRTPLEEAGEIRGRTLQPRSPEDLSRDIAYKPGHVADEFKEVLGQLRETADRARRHMERTAETIFRESPSLLERKGTPKEYVKLIEEELGRLTREAEFGWERMHLRALMHAYRMGPVMIEGRVLTTKTFDPSDFRHALKNKQLELDQIDDPEVLRRYTSKVREITLKLERQKLTEPKISPIKTSAAYMRLQAERTLLTNGRVARAGKHDPLDELILELKTVRQQGIYNEAVDRLNTTKLKKALEAQQRLHTGYSTGDWYREVLSPEAQAREINDAYQQVTRRIAHLAKEEGSFFRNATVNLVVENESTFNIPLKVFKLVIKTPKGRPMELRLPTTQLGYTVLGSNVLPLNAPLLGWGNRLSNTLPLSTLLSRRLPVALEKALSDWQESQSGTIGAGSWNRILDDARRLTSPATGTAGDVFKQLTVINRGVELLNGLASKGEYESAFKAQSTIQSWRTATNLGGVRIFSFDTEFMKPRGFEKRLGSSLWSGKDIKDTRIWQLAFDLIDPMRQKAIHNAGGTLYIKPSNWDQIKGDVVEYLTRMSGGKNAPQEKIDQIMSLVESIDNMDSKKSLRDALRRIEGTFGLSKGPVQIVAQNQTESDLRIFANQIREELPKKEAEEWLKKLSPLLNRDLSTAGHRQSDIMYWWKGYSLGQPTLGNSNDAIFRQLYKGLSMDQFGELLETSWLPERKMFDPDKASVRNRVRRILDTSKVPGFEKLGRLPKKKIDEIFKGTWKAYRRFIDIGFPGSIRFTSHVEARYDEIITTLNFFELMKRDRLIPTSEEAYSRVLMEEAADIHRRFKAGIPQPWDKIMDIYDRAEYSYHTREPLFDLYSDELFDPKTGMLKKDDFYRAGVFSVPHRQASLGRASLLDIERMVPGGLLNNVLRTKYQIFNSRMITANPAKILSEWKLLGAGSPAEKGNPILLSLESAYDTAHAHSLSQYQRVLSTLTPNIPGVWESKFTTVSDNIRVPTLLLPDSLDIVNDGKIYIKDAIAKALSIRGYGSGPGEQILKVTLPIKPLIAELHKEIKGRGEGARSLSLGEFFRRLPADPRIARAFEDRPLFDKTGKLITQPQEVRLEGADIITLKPGERLFGEGIAGQTTDVFEDQFISIADDVVYKGKTEGYVTKIKFDPRENLFAMEIARPSGVYAGTKAIIGKTMVVKGVEHAPLGPLARGFGKIGVTAGYKLGGSRDELGSLIEIQINRVLDKVYSETHGTDDQKARLKKILKPLFGKEISTGSPDSFGVVYPAVRLRTMPVWAGPGEGTHERTVVAVDLTDQAPKKLYQHAEKGLYRPLSEMLKEAGVDYNYVKRQFEEQAREVVKTEVEVRTLWNEAIGQGKKMIQRRIDSLTSELKKSLPEWQRKLFTHEMAFMKSQLATLTKRAGPMLWDPAVVDFSATTDPEARGLSRVVVFPALRAGMPISVAETTPYEFARDIMQRETRAGLPGGVRTSPYDRLILEHTIRMLDDSTGAKASTTWIRDIEKSFGAARFSMRTGTSVMAESMEAINIARLSLLYGTAGNSIKGLDDRIVATLDRDQLRKLVDVLDEKAAGKRAGEGAIDTFEFMGEVFDVPLSEDRTKWLAQLEEAFKDDPDLRYRAAEIEAITRSDTVMRIRADRLEGMEFFRRAPSDQAQAMKIRLPNLSRLEKTHGKAYAYLQQMIDELQKGKTPKESPEAIFGKLTFNIERDIIDKLESRSGESQRVKQILAAMARFKGRGDVKLDSVTLPRMVGALELYTIPQSVGGYPAPRKVIGGYQRRIVDALRSADALKTAAEDVSSVAEKIQSELELGRMAENQNLKETAREALRQFIARRDMMKQQIPAELLRSALAPAYSLTAHKIFAAWMPSSYSVAFGHMGLLPTLRDLYSTMKAGAEGKLSQFGIFNEMGYSEGDFIKKLGFKSPGNAAEKVFGHVDIRESFQNLIKPPRGVTAGKNPLFSKRGDILFRGLGINQSVISLSSAKSMIQEEIVNRGRDVSPEMVRWLKGETPYIMRIGRQPTSGHNIFGISAVYVAPDELYKLIGIPVERKGMVSSILHVDLLLARTIGADFDRDLLEISMIEDSFGADKKKAAELHRMHNKATWKLLASYVEDGLREGKKNPYDLHLGVTGITDIKELYRQLGKFEEMPGGHMRPVKFDSKVANLSYTLTNPNDKDRLKHMSIEELLPKKFYQSFGEVEYELLRGTKVDEYLTQPLAVGRIGAIQKLLVVQALGHKNSAYAQIKNLYKEKGGPKMLNRILEKRNLKDFIGEASKIPGIVDRLYEVSTGPSTDTLIDRYAEWSGEIQQQVAIQKYRQRLEGARDTASKFLRAASVFLYDLKATPEERTEAIKVLAFDPSNKKMSWLYKSYDAHIHGPFNKLSQSEFNSLQRRAEQQLGWHHALYQIAHELAPQRGTDFQWMFLKQAAQGEDAVLMSLLGQDYALSSAISAQAAPWARNLGFLTQDYQSLLVKEYLSGGKIFQRSSAVEMLGQKIKEMMGETSYRVLGKNAKIAGLAALGLMALDPNANSLILGDTQGRGGEEYDLPTLASLANVYKTKRPKVSEPSAPFLDKLRHLVGLPGETMPQLRLSGDRLPQRPPIRYTGKRRGEYNRLNIDQAIKSAQVIIAN